MSSELEYTSCSIPYKTKIISIVSKVDFYLQESTSASDLEYKYKPVNDIYGKKLCLF
jgi:hypothetical protein